MDMLDFMDFEISLRSFDFLRVAVELPAKQQLEAICFLTFCHKRPPGLKDEPIRFWLSDVALASPKLILPKSFTDVWLHEMTK